MLFIVSFFMLLCTGLRVRKKLDKNVYTPVDPCTKESWSRDGAIPTKHSTYVNFTLLNKQRKTQKTPSKRDTNFYLKMTVTTIIVGLYGQ